MKAVVLRKFRRLVEVAYNLFITYIPSHNVRLFALRLAGAEIGPSVSVFRGTTVLAADSLTIGQSVSIGFRCMLDARGGLSIGDRTVLASDTQVITAAHEVDSATFDAYMAPVKIGSYVWLASRVTVLPGVTIEDEAVVGACSLVRTDVGPKEVVAGVPARYIKLRTADLDYDPAYRPLFY
jgi:putative colanic acid biosynthesis acetyltransferase WcaF